MRQSRFSEEQMVAILREADRGSVAEAARKHKISEQTIYIWRKKFGVLEASDVKKPRSLEAENVRLKRMLARNPYEFGVKLIVATTLKEGFVVSMRSMLGNPYDGRTVEEAIEQVSILAQRIPKTVILDRGYQGAELEGIRILRSGQKRGISRTLHARIKRRSASEPTIAHMKTDERLGRNPLKSALGDALHAVLCGAGHDIMVAAQGAAASFYLHRLDNQRRQSYNSRCPSTGSRVKSQLFRTDQLTKEENQLCTPHASEVSCTLKGKALSRYEFGVTVTVAITLEERFIVGMRLIPSNSYDRHTLAETIEQIKTLTERTPKTLIVESGYQRAQFEGIRILRSVKKDKPNVARNNRTLQRNRTNDRRYEDRRAPCTKAA